MSADQVVEEAFRFYIAAPKSIVIVFLCLVAAVTLGALFFILIGRKGSGM